MTIAIQGRKGRPRDAWIRFEKEIKVSLITGCWLWQGARHLNGYGQFRFRERNWLAHRVSFVLYHQQEIPPGMRVLHSCDNPGCVNPFHLSLGTQAENLADMTNKGRRSRGSDFKNAKLTDDMVRQIRADPRIHRVIAEEYGVSQAVVTNIKNRRRWTHVTEEQE
jgi:HNH endonuclease